jgi:hypothetical protein
LASRLSPLDFFITDRLRLGGYARYGDNLLIAHDDRQRLKAGVPAIEDFLAGELRLRLHPSKRCSKRGSPVRRSPRPTGAASPGGASPSAAASNPHAAA